MIITKFEQIDFSKQYTVLKINFEDETFNRKLKNLGIYEKATINFKKIGNYKYLIGLEANDVTNIIRLKDLSNIIFALKEE